MLSRLTDLYQVAGQAELLVSKKTVPDRGPFSLFSLICGFEAISLAIWGAIFEAMFGSILKAILDSIFRAMFHLKFRPIFQF